MRLLSPALLLATASLSPSLSAALPSGAYGWMADLAGHCWSATYADGTSDTQCYTSQYEHYLRGTIEIVAGGEGGRAPYRGDSIFFWDGELGEMSVHYWSSAGSHGVMTGRIEGESIHFSSPASSDGTPPDTRTVWTRSSADSFQVVRQRRSGANWTTDLTLTYRRSAPATPSADVDVRR